MQVKTYRSGSVGEVDFDERPFFDKQSKDRVLYRTLKDNLVMFQANQRLGTASTRGRSSVRGTNKKPYKQKHTGRARAGDRKSPIWRGGGTVFGPKPRDYSYHMPKKARRIALRTALLGKLKDGEVVIADLGEFPVPSARAARKVMQDLKTPRRTLVVLAEPDLNVWKSFRNFPGVKVRIAPDVCAHDVVAAGLIVTESRALDAIVERVGRDLSSTDATQSAAEATTTEVPTKKASTKKASTKKASTKKASGKKASTKKASGKKAPDPEGDDQ